MEGSNLLIVYITQSCVFKACCTDILQKHQTRVVNG